MRSGCSPHRVENFKFSKDPQFVEKVRDIVGLHMNPPDRPIVLCLDEKTQVQALNRTEPILPLTLNATASNGTQHVTDTGTFSRWGQPLHLAAPTASVPLSTISTQ